MPQSVLQPIIFEDRRIIFRNFTGAPGQYNAAGDRNFNVLLDQAEAIAMTNDGWNVKYLRARDEGEEPQPRLEVSVKFGKIPPQVMLVTSRGKTRLDEDMLQILDWCEIKTVDMIVRPYQWEVNGRTGVKAYLKSIWVTILEDALEKKYMDVPDTAVGALEWEESAPPAIQMQSEVLAITRGEQTPF
jgi:hypothetical protein